MATVKKFSGKDEEEVWSQLVADLAANPDPLEYSAVLNQNHRPVDLDIDIDLGGGFEGGSESTRFGASFANPSGFRFALHHETFLDEIGKFLGMQDVELGDQGFDKSVVVKASDEAKVKTLFADESVRTLISQLEGFHFGIHHADADGLARLEFSIDEGIVEPERLRPLYQAFFRVLQSLI